MSFVQKRHLKSVKRRLIDFIDGKVDANEKLAFLPPQAFATPPKTTIITRNVPKPSLPMLPKLGTCFVAAAVHSKRAGAGVYFGRHELNVAERVTGNETPESALLFAVLRALERTSVIPATTASIHGYKSTFRLMKARDAQVESFCHLRICMSDERLFDFLRATIGNAGDVPTHLKDLVRKVHELASKRKIRWRLVDPTCHEMKHAAKLARSGLCEDSFLFLNVD